MKFILIITLFFLVFAAEASSLKVFSMNLHCGLGDWEARMETIIQEILRRDPDVIGLQEVCYNDKMNMTNHILEKLKEGGYPVTFWKTTDTHRSFVHYQEQLLIITKKPVKTSLESALPSVKFVENRLVAIEIEEGWAITTHLHFALPQIRENQYKKISSMFSDKKAVIFGDMNSNPKNGETKIFHQKGWEHYFPGPTYPSDKPKSTFDGYWTSAALSRRVIKASPEILFENEKNPPSDHLGIYIELELK